LETRKWEGCAAAEGAGGTTSNLVQDLMLMVIVYETANMLVIHAQVTISAFGIHITMVSVSTAAAFDKCSGIGKGVGQGICFGGNMNGSIPSPF
jgi:hypothetical protein